MEEMNAALAVRDRSADGGRLVLQQVVTDGPDGDVAYAVEIDGGRVRLTSGRAAAPDVTATRQCKATSPGLRPVIVTNSTVRPDEIAADVDRVADGLAGLAGRLRTLPATAADQPRISGWLDGWVEYAAIGHRYAAALRD